MEELGKAAVAHVLNELLKRSSNEFDEIEDIFSIVREVTEQLLIKKYDRLCLEKWATEEDNPLFIQFEVNLKAMLESQSEYMIMLLDGNQALLPDIGQVTDKINASRQQIDKVTKGIKLRLSERDELLSTNKELIELQNNYDALLQEQTALQEMLASYKPIDIDSLRIEVINLDKETEELKSAYDPLLNKRKDLQGAIEDLETKTSSVLSEIKNLEETFGEEATKCMQNIDEWIRGIARAVDLHNDKARQYSDELEKKKGELATVDAIIADELSQIREFEQTSAKRKEVFEIHHLADKKIGENMSKILPDRQRELAQVSETIAGRLKEFDRLLSDLHERINQGAESIRPLHFGSN